MEERIKEFEPYNSETATPPIVAFVVPCHNEETVLPSSTSSIYEKMEELKTDNLISEESFLLFVDDGSSDNTWGVIQNLSHRYNNVKGIRLAVRVGHQTALLAGIDNVCHISDASITLDADLQDDISIVPQMLKAFTSGADVVCGVRENRDCDTWFKRHSAQTFYKTMRMLGVDCLYNHADFRLLSARAMNDLMEYGERNIFLRGIVPRLGYRQESIIYERQERKMGKTKYPVKRMVEFAIDGITSFSVKPVRMLFWLGLFFLLAAIGIGIYTLIRHFTGETVEGWTSLILSIWFCTGILLIGMGIMGEYIGKIYIEVKHRPRYKISEQT